MWNEPYKDGLHELVVYYASLPSITEMILRFQSIRSVIEAFYQVMTKQGELEEIGYLPLGERQTIWKLTEGLEKDERVKASRAIYLMEKILEK